MKFVLRRADIESVVRELQEGLNKLTLADNADVANFLEVLHWSPLPLRTTLTTSLPFVHQGNYSLVGKRVDLDCRLDFTIGGGASTDIYLPLPVLPAAISAGTILACMVVDTVGAGQAGVAIIGRQNGGEVLVRNSGGTNWTTGAKTIRLSGHYWRDI